MIRFCENYSLEHSLLFSKTKCQFLSMTKLEDVTPSPIIFNGDPLLFVITMEGSILTVVSTPNWANFEKKIKWSQSTENWYIAALNGIFYESEKKIWKKFSEHFFFKKFSKKIFQKKIEKKMFQYFFSIFFFRFIKYTI